MSSSGMSGTCGAFLTEFVRYYNEDRPHRALDLEPPAGPKVVEPGPIVAQPVLGGLHHVYRRAA